MRHHPATPRRRRTAVSAAGLLLALTLAGCSGDEGDPVAVTPTSPSSSPTGSPAETSPDTQEPAATQEQEASSDETSMGGVVPGLPPDIVPVPDDADVLLTSAIPNGDMLDVSLTARIAASPEDVLGLYREALTGAGFTESPSAGGPGATAATFTRSDGAEVVSVAVVPPATPGDPNSYTVGGTVLAP